MEKCEIEHPPLFHNDSCKLIHDEFVMMNSCSSGSCGSIRTNRKQMESEIGY